MFPLSLASNEFQYFSILDHAAHVTMSMSKMLVKIVVPELDPTQSFAKNFEAMRHDHTYVRSIYCTFTACKSVSGSISRLPVLSF